jgi:CubicO group peptidase (beta-lactamase class C family)
VTPIDDFLRREIALGSFPGAVYAIGSSHGIERENALGHAVVVPFRIPATLDTIYDCASLTKPLITTTLALQLFDLNLRVSDVGSRGSAMTPDIRPPRFDDRFRALLTHTSGLRAWMPLYMERDYLSAIREHGPEYEPGARVVYSDLNFILLWSMLHDYVRLARERIFAPLGIESEAMFCPPPALRPRIAATEWGQRFEAALAGRPEIAARRDGLMWGEVHDGNSFGAGGTAGNAGLFATARAVFRIAQSWANAELLTRALVEEATRNQTAGLNESRGLGWQISPSGMYGHTGFTGTSVLIDPERDRIMVLLTNRVHPCAAPNSMQRIRAEFHRLALTS